MRELDRAGHATGPNEGRTLQDVNGTVCRIVIIVVQNTQCIIFRTLHNTGGLERGKLHAKQTGSYE